VAALSHPNILSIFDFGTDQGEAYAVMELLEGETLRTKLRSGPLPLKKAVAYAIQIALGLAAAHEKGVIHRDLKPENLFITKDGRVKILDFGLAKVAHPELAGGAQGDSPTLRFETEPGTILGTVGYMSPEQVRGKNVDHRSDLFSFGATLYEMLTAKRAFEGDSPADAMSAVLTSEPPELLDTAKNVPPELDRIVRHCLEKDPQERFQSARDILFSLESLSAAGGTATMSMTMPRAAVLAPEKKALPGWAVPAAALAALVLAGLAYFLGARGRKVELPTFKQITFRRGLIRSARIAPDGQTIVYAAAWDGEPVKLYLKHRDSPDAIPLDLQPANILAISKNGELAIALGCVRTHAGVCAGTLARAALTGGAARQIEEGVQQADWNKDGTELAIVKDVNGKARLEYPPGTLLYDTTGHISFPRFSPQGDTIAFVDHPIPRDDRGAIAILDVKTKKVTKLTPQWESVQGLAFSPKGDEIWFSAAEIGNARSLLSTDLSGKTRVRLRVPGTLKLHDISPAGQVLLTRDAMRVGILALPPGETRERDLSWLEYSIAADLSADGKTLLFQEAGEAAGANYAVCIRKTDGSPVVRLGDGAAFSLSPDGKWAISNLPAKNEPFVLLPTAAGAPKTLQHKGIVSVSAASWFPAGDAILFAGKEEGHGVKLYVLKLDGSDPKPLVPNEVTIPFNSGIAISPDGNLVAGVGSDGNGFLVPASGGDLRPLKGLAAGQLPIRFSGDGKAIFVTRLGELPLKIVRIDLATGAATALREFHPGDPAGIDAVSTIRLTPDGASYA
ncbi:MAG TPA: WD40 repeat domain-containing serine/threonine protein kinase, partial [Thermoanaerobaculia bacterium]|nr:WD40 repeat domain-containing serine/threonine protein kinase [Thermoanaerobaculia bacterium]